MELIVFNFLGGTYAIELKRTKVILVHSQTNITPLFNESSWVSGLINLRGDVAPIVDLRVRFSDKEPSFTEDTVIIIVKAIDEKLIGIVVDCIESIKDIDTSYMIPPPELGIGINPEYITGLYKNDENEMITILDVDKILDIKEL